MESARELDARMPQHTGSVASQRIDAIAQAIADTEARILAEVTDWLTDEARFGEYAHSGSPFSFKAWLVEQTEDCIKNSSCKKCGGIIVKSYSQSLMAQRYGKRCLCRAT